MSSAEVRPVLDLDEEPVRGRVLDAVPAPAGRPLRPGVGRFGRPEMITRGDPNTTQCSARPVALQAQRWPGRQEPLTL